MCIALFADNQLISIGNYYTIQWTSKTSVEQFIRYLRTSIGFQPLRRIHN